MTETRAAEDRTIRLEMYPVKGRLLSVSRIEDLSRRMRRIVLSGDDLEQHFPYHPMTPGDHVKICVPDENGVVTLPDFTPDGIKIGPGTPRPAYRDYTVRSYDAERGELALDFVLHDHGIAGRWAIRAQVGDQVGVLGPRGSYHYPADYGWYLVAGDETALPAIGRWIDDLRAIDGQATVLIEVDGPEDEIDLRPSAGVEVRWVHRDPARPDAFEAAIREVALPADDDYFVWIAGEAGELKPIRRYFRREIGLDKNRLDIDGYWKQGVVNLDHHAADDED